MTKSIGILDDWAQTVTEGNRQPPAESSAPNLGTLAQPGFELLRTANEFIQILKSLSVEGPLALTSNLLSEYVIGKGGQFTVYRSSISGQNLTVPWKTTAAAIKRCKIVLGPNQVIDLTGDDAKRQVHNTFLEVLVLRDPLLRSHRNIVQLLGWAHEDGFNALPLLVMELATEGDLTKFMSGPMAENWDVRHHLCLDMAAGLDAIHRCGIIHADFKPENVLIFQNDSEDVPLIAKLSDFGFSEPEAKTRSGSMIYITALSKGWQAPEVSLTMPPTSITTDGYKKADNYSLGLVIWSVCCFRGRPPPENSNSGALALALRMLGGLPTIPESLRKTFGFGLEQLLCYDAAQRPEYTLEFFRDNGDATAKWQQDQIRDGSRNITTTDVAQSDEFPHPLSMQSIQQYRWAGLKKSFEEFGSLMTGDELFSFFLEGTYNAIPERNITTDASLPIQQLLLSAERGFSPAQAVIDRVLRSYGIDWPTKYLINRQPWLFEGTALGCSIARTDLRALDAATADRAVEEFYRRGGYQQHYYSDAKTTLWRRWRDDNWQSNASLLRISISELGIGDMAQFDPTAKDESSPTPSVLRCQNSGKDIALNKHELLYLSCLAGDPKAVSKLCIDGADASIIGEPGGATCLHWLFAFPEHEIHNVAGHLIRNGAQIDAELTTSLPVTKYTFPFSWPPGTALHWAVATSSCRAARVLISNGADCCRRNGDDPYMYDMNVRYLEQQGEDDSQGSYSVPSGICLGMSPVDLAACSHDFKILSEILAIGGPSSSYCAGDEEGYTAFHRLQYNHIGRTIDERRFSYSAFNGPPVMRRESAFRVIQVLKEMGGDINALTKPSPHNVRKNDRPGSLTPLMLAVRAIDLDTVTSLLKHGSNVNNRNELGYNVLSQLPEGNDFKLCFDDLPAIVELLLKYRSQITAKDPFLGFTPLASAIECKNLDVMRLLLEAGADLTEKIGELGVMSLWVGSLDVLSYMLSWTKKRLWRERDAKMAELLTQYVFSRHADEVRRVLNDVDEYGSGLLHYAVASGQPTVVQAVLAAGADAEAYRKEIKSPRGFRMNSAAAIGVSGSPLDVCLHMKEKCLANCRRGQANISPEDYGFMLKMYDEIELMLSNL